MQTPALIRDALVEMNERYGARRQAIPTEARLHACRPDTFRSYTTAELDDCVAWTRWKCWNAYRHMKRAAKWAIEAKGKSGMSAIVDRERFASGAKGMKEARILRDDWIAHRDAVRVPDTLAAE